MRKPRFSLTQHIKAGQILKDMRRVTARLRDEVEVAYPKKTKAVRAIYKIYDALYDAVDSLNDELRREIGLDGNIKRIYYSTIEDDLSDEEIQRLIQQ